MGKALQSMPRSLPPMMSPYTLTPAFLTLKRTRLVCKTFHSVLTLSCWCQSECMSPCYFQVVMVFPGPQAVSVQDMIQCLHDQSNSRLHHTSYEPMKKRLKCDDLEGSTCTAESFQTGSADATKGIEPRQCLLQRVVFIDSTWNQTNKISTDERLQGNQKLCTCLSSWVVVRPHWFLKSSRICVFLLDLLQVELKMRKTCFWRHQKGKPDSYLATIEAIYYFLRDYHKYCLGQEYDGEYDNLLFFYSFLHSVVNKAKTERKTWATQT